MSEVVLSVPFRYRSSGEVVRVLSDFRDMVNFFVDKALASNITGYAKLRKAFYGEWKQKWGRYSTHYCHSACLVAISMLRSWRKLKKKGMTNSDGPVAKKLFMRLDPVLFKFYGDRLRLSVEPRRFLWLELVVGEYQRRFVQAWKRGELKAGEAIINGQYVLIPFRKQVNLAEPKDWMAIDINEANLTGVSTNPLILKLEHPLRTIHTTYFQIKRNIQGLSKDRPKTSRRLLKKYSGREKARARDVCHKLSKVVVDFARKHGFGIIMEDLRGIRRRVDYGRRMNRRLHTWNFRRIQSYIEYKAKLAGLPVIYISPRKTSSLCPMCGERLAPNRHRRVNCGACGYENDRDITACLNLHRMRGAPLPPKALNEPLIMEVRGKG